MTFADEHPRAWAAVMLAIVVAAIAALLLMAAAETKTAEEICRDRGGVREQVEAGPFGEVIALCKDGYSNQVTDLG